MIEVLPSHPCRVDDIIMAKAKKTPKKQPESVFREAWENMSEDFNRLLPEKLRQRPGKKKFVLWLFVAEMVVLGMIGTAVYRWWIG